MKVGVLGATGFTGEKLVDILKSHPGVSLSYLTSRTPQPVAYSSFFPRFKEIVDIPCERLDLKKAVKKADIFFLSLPHRVSMEVAPYLLKAGKKVIDLSADYRLKNPSLYKKTYGTSHKDKKNLKKSVYGLPELFREKIVNADLVANPGCYATSIILAVAPLLKEKLITPNIVVDAYSSITGAGRKAVIDYHYAHVEGNIWAYKPFVHQHMPEILQTVREATGVGVDIDFVPHVVGVASGIYATVHVRLKKSLTGAALRAVYKRYYAKSIFVRIKDNLPKLKDVVGTNFCDVGLSVHPAGRRAVIVSCIDNLIKGAAGTAVQNMNIMLGFKESEGLL